MDGVQTRSYQVVMNGAKETKKGADRKADEARKKQKTQRMSLPIWSHRQEIVEVRTQDLPGDKGVHLPRN